MMATAAWCGEDGDARVRIGGPLVVGDRQRDAELPGLLYMRRRNLGGRCPIAKITTRDTI